MHFQLTTHERKKFKMQAIKSYVVDDAVCNNYSSFQISFLHVQKLKCILSNLKLLIRAFYCFFHLLKHHDINYLI